MNRTHLTGKAKNPTTRLVGVAAVLLLLALVVFPKISRAAEEGNQEKQLFGRRYTGCPVICCGA